MEFRAVHRQALSEGRALVIIVICGKIEATENLDSELRYYLNTNTYVKRGDPRFWDKLEYALSHPPKFTNGVKSNYFANGEPNIQTENI